VPGRTDNWGSIDRSIKNYFDSEEAGPGVLVRGMSG